jgi:tetratricopeptide (TPR) repeat protein
MRRAGDLRPAVVLAIATGLTLTLAFNAYLAVREKVEWYAAIGSAPLEGIVTFPWESVNTLPVLVLLAIAFLAWLPAGAVRTALAVIVGISALVVIPTSQGRAGYVALAVAVVAYVLLLPTTGRFVARSDPRRLALVAAGAAVAVVAGLVVLGPRFAEAVETSGRLLIWDQGWNMVAGGPLVGSGPGVYSWVRMEFPPAGADLLAVRLLHNVPLLTLVEGGVVLLVGVAVALGMWVWAALRPAHAWGTGERVTVAALAGFAAASLLDDFSFLPSVIGIVLAMAAFLAPVPRAPVGQRAWLMPAVLALATVAALPAIVGVDLARAAAQEGRTAMMAGDYDGAMAAFNRATRAHPESGAYWLGLGMAAAYAEDRERAIAAYEQSTATAPGDSRGYAALAALLPPARQVEQLRAAAERTLDDPQDAARLGLALARADDIAGATRAWASAVALRAEILRLLPYSGTAVTMKAVAEDALRLIDANPRPAPHENDAARWDIGLATDSLPADAGPAWRAVDAARDGDLDAARELADEAVAAAPYEARGYQATAAVAAFACDSVAELEALALERHAIGAYLPPDTEPRALREFFYREASLGASQPPGARLNLRIERWPWSLVDRPTSCG